MNFFKICPLEIFHWYDGPKAFTLLDVNNKLHFAYWLEESDLMTNFIVVPKNINQIKELKANKINIYDFLNVSPCILIGVDNERNVLIYSEVDFEEIPKDFLPCQGIKLYG